MNVRRAMKAIGCCAMWVGQIAGCAGPAPSMLPPAPARTETLSDGAVDRYYDVNGDGRLDYAERLAADGRIRSLRYDVDQSGAFAKVVDLPVSPSEARHLLIILDSVPYPMVRDLWEQGRFRFFNAPSRTISPFPVMTDLALSEFFGVSPCPGVESEFYDSRALRGGYDNYANARNVPWQKFADYHLWAVAHAWAYPDPHPWFDHELGRIQKEFLASKKSPFIGYTVCPSGIGAKFGRSGHLSGLIRVDRLCQSLMHRLEGRLHITLMSDHGHNLIPSKRIPLSDILRTLGYRVRDRLDRPGDVVVPEFGVVTAASIYSLEPARVAADVTNIEGIDLAAYVDESGAVVVLKRDAAARISAAAGGFRYTPERGDPLELTPILERLRAEGKLGADGAVADALSFEATVDHVYPDALQRLWRAFHGLTVHTPEVLVSVEDGYNCGSKLMTEIVDVQAAHGNLNLIGSSGFVMTTMGELPGVMRIGELRQNLNRLGGALPGR